MQIKTTSLWSNNQLLISLLLELFSISFSPSEPWSTEDSLQDLCSPPQVSFTSTIYHLLFFRLFILTVEKLFTTHDLFCLLPWPLFSRCPFLLNLDLVGIANRFAQFNLPAFALGTLLLIPSAEKKAQQIHVSLHTFARSKPLGIDPWIKISWESFPNFILFEINSYFCNLLNMSALEDKVVSFVVCHISFSSFVLGRFLTARKTENCRNSINQDLAASVESRPWWMEHKMTWACKAIVSAAAPLSCWSLCWCFQGFLSVCNPVAVLEQVDELMDTGELAGIPSQVRFLQLDVAAVLF